jgi:hypothetical protein
MLNLKLQPWVRDQALRDCLFVIASFDMGLPLISGFGCTLAQAWNVAGRQQIPSGSVVCARVPSCELLWRDALGREVRPEHFVQEVREGDYLPCQ